MNLNDLAQKAWGLPWIFKAFVVLALGSYVWTWFKKWREQSIRAAAETWPAVMGHVVAREIKERKQGEEQAIIAFVAVVSYSYFQEEQYAGVYKREFDSHDEAGEWLDFLYDKQVQVRFDPAKPSRSTLLAADLPLPPNYSQAARLYDPSTKDDIFGSIGKINADSGPLVMTLSLAGLVICLILHVMSLVGEPFGSGVRFALLFATQIYTMSCFGFAFRLDRDNSEKITQAAYKKQIAAITPDIVRIVQKVLSAYAMVWLATFFYRDMVLHQNKQIDPLPLFTAAQAIFLFDAYCKTQLARWRYENRNRP